MMNDNDIMRELMGGDNPFVAIENQVYGGMLNMMADQMGLDDKGRMGLNTMIKVFNRHGIPTKTLMEIVVEIAKELEAMNNGE